MSLADLFNPPPVRIPQTARRITLVDVETREEAEQRVRASLKKARAAKAMAPKPAPKTREQRLAERRARYAARRAAGEPPTTSRKRPYSALTEAEREVYRAKQRAWYYANREVQLARSKAKYAAMTEEQRKALQVKNRAWAVKNRDRLNERDRARRAEQKRLKVLARPEVD
jgi:hypothetical protein